MNKLYYFLLGGILCLSTFLSLWKLGSIDIEGSEDIYVTDSIGYLRGDVYMAPRYHLRKPHYPAAPHPFFVPLLNAQIFKLFGLSLTSARVLQAISIVMTTAVVMLFSQILWNSRRVALLSGLLFTTTPLVVRYGRMAVLDPVLMLIEVLGMLFLWQMWTSSGLRQWLFAVFTGVMTGLAVSTKLTGIFFLFSIIGGLMYVYFKRRKDVRICAVLIMCSFVFVFFLFNDPGAYLWGWTHFNESISKNKVVSVTGIVRGIIDYRYWFYFVTTLIGLPFLGLGVYAVVTDYRRLFTKQHTFLVIWSIPLVGYMILNPPHGTGLSSEWAYLPLMPPASLLVSWFLDRLLTVISRMRQLIVILAWSFGVGIPLVLFGLRLYPLPLPNLKNARNAVVGDLAVTRIVEILNQDKQQVRVLVVLKGVIIPLWLLNNNIISEPRYRELDLYNYIVTDDTNLVFEALRGQFLIKKLAKNPSEGAVYLLRRK